MTRVMMRIRWTAEALRHIPPSRLLEPSQRRRLQPVASTRSSWDNGMARCGNSSLPPRPHWLKLEVQSHPRHTAVREEEIQSIFLGEPGAAGVDVKISVDPPATLL
jgi:hypothetical protein